MQRRFTLIQGGLIKHWTAPAVATLRDRDWRIDLRRPAAVDGAIFSAWRGLSESQPSLDPFSHPEYLLTAARHGGRGLELALAFVFEPAPEGAEILSGVLPLVMSHPIWGRSVRLWQPTLVRAPVEPLVRTGAAAAAIEALVRHLLTVRPRAGLHLENVPAAGPFLRDLTASGRLTLDTRIGREPVPQEPVVQIRQGEAAEWIESVTDPSGVRDAVERILLAESEATSAPLLAEPDKTAITRVVPRLFAHRGWTSIELGWRGNALVSAAIRLGRPESRILWRALNLEEEQSTQRAADIDVRLCESNRESLPGRLWRAGS